MIGRTIGVINPASGKMIPAIVRGLTKNFELTVSYESKNSCSNTASKEYGANSGVINLRSGEAVFLNPQFPLV